MNFKLYIFGESSGYKQYPDDSNCFKEYFKYQHSNSSLYIQRKADLVYYVYSQKIDKEKNSFLGFCLVFNGVYIKNFKNAFAIFEKIYSDCILSGKLFRLGENGKICYATDVFSSQTEEYDRLVSVFNDELEKKNRTLFAQLPKTYKMGQGTKVFSMSDSPELIADGISVYDSVSISNNSNNEDLDYVERMLQKLYSENKKLKTQYEILNKQKKQYRWVAILSICVIIGLYFLNDKFNSIKNAFPINITNIEIGNTYPGGTIETNYGSTIYSSNTMYLRPRITYTGINTGRSINLKIRWYRPDGTMSSADSSPSGYSQQDSLYVYSGSNTETLKGWGNKSKGCWGKGTYRIEIWYENVCLKAKTFTIY